MNKKITWGDIQEAPIKELKRIYKLNDMQLEQQVRTHMDGANPQERRDLYKKVWNKK